jgi:hypothetical protein
VFDVNSRRDSEPSRGERPGSPVVNRPGWLLAALILTCAAMGYAIYWLLKSMRI